MTGTIRATVVAVLAVSALHSTGCVGGGNSCGADDCGGGGGGRGGLLARRGAAGDATLQQKYNSCVDPCWPERYNYQARELTLSPFANQVANGQALDQTIFNGDFEAGTAILSPGGLQKLDTIARRRPVDGRIYVQTSRDIIYDPAKREEYVKGKADLDAARSDAVQGYLAASTTGRRVNFDVAISDPQDMMMPVIGPANSVRGYAFQHVSGITGIAGNGFAGAGGANFTSSATGGNFGGAFGPGATNAQAPNLSSNAPAASGLNTTGGR